MITDEVLQQVEDFAYRYMSKDEIITITGIDTNSFDDQESNIYKKFLRGRLMRKAEFNYSIIQLSNQLSSPAMQMEVELSKNTHLTDLRQ